MHTLPLHSKREPTGTAAKIVFMLLSFGLHADVGMVVSVTDFVALQQSLLHYFLGVYPRFLVESA
jgi:hypothetical protein